MVYSDCSFCRSAIDVLFEQQKSRIVSASVPLRRIQCSCSLPLRPLQQEDAFLNISNVCKIFFAQTDQEKLDGNRSGFIFSFISSWSSPLCSHPLLYHRKWRRGHGRRVVRFSARRHLRHTTGQHTQVPSCINSWGTFLSTPKSLSKG